MAKKTKKANKVRQPKAEVKKSIKTAKVQIDKRIIANPDMIIISKRTLQRYLDNVNTICSRAIQSIESIRNLKNIMFIGAQDELESCLGIGPTEEDEVKKNKHMTKDFHKVLKQKLKDRTKNVDPTKQNWEELASLKVIQENLIPAKSALNNITKK